MDKQKTLIYLHNIKKSNLDTETKMLTSELTGYIDGLTDILDFINKYNEKWE